MPSGLDKLNSLGSMFQQSMQQQEAPYKQVNDPNAQDPNAPGACPHCGQQQGGVDASGLISKIIPAAAAAV